MKQLSDSYLARVRAARSLYRLGLPVLFLLCCAVVPAYGEQVESGVRFAQVSFTYPLAAQRYSSYAEISVYPGVLSGDGYLNVERFVDGQPAGWVVRNLRVVDGSIGPDADVMLRLGASGYQQILSVAVDFSSTPLADDESLKDEDEIPYLLEQTESALPAPSEQAIESPALLASAAAEPDPETSWCTTGAGPTAVTWVYQKLVDTTVNVPPTPPAAASAGPFFVFGAPSISVGAGLVVGGPPAVAVVYSGYPKPAVGTAPSFGIYLSNPAVAPPSYIVAVGQAINPTTTFTVIAGNPVISTLKSVGFFGRDSTRTPGAWSTTVAVPRTYLRKVPNVTAPFTVLKAFPGAAFNVGIFGFSGTLASGVSGIYQASGPPGYDTVADTTTNRPGDGSVFNFFNNPSISAAVEAFRATAANGGKGVYLGTTGVPAGTVLDVADDQIACPKGTAAGNFTDADEPSISQNAAGRGGFVAYRGLGCTPLARAIYSSTYAYVPPAAPTVGAPALVAAGGCPIPGGTGNFTALHEVSQSVTGLIFKGLGTKGQQGIYFAFNGEKPQRVVDLTTMLNGKTPTSLHIWRSSLFTDIVNGPYLAFRVTFTDGTTAIYLANQKFVPPGPPPPLL